MDLLTKYGLPVVIGMIMFNLGLSLKFNDFRQIFTAPKPLLLGLICQIVLLPIIAFLLAYFSNLPVSIKTGLVIIAACPGGATSNLISYLLKGDVALSISLTAVNSLIILFTIPLYIYLALSVLHDKGSFITLPFLPTVLKIVLMLLLPTLLGMLTHMKFKKAAKKMEFYLKYITTVLLALIFTLTIVDNKENTPNSVHLYFRTAPYALILNLAGMFAGYVAGRLAGFSKSKQITLAIEIGIQNSALAITLASSQIFLGSSRMAIPAVVYGMFTFFNAVVFGYIIKKWIT